MVHIFHRTVFSPFPACCPAPSWTWHCIRSAAYLLQAHGLSTRNWTKHVPAVSILLKYSPKHFSADGSMAFHSKSPGYPWATPPKLPSACRVKSASRASSNEASNRASWSPKQVSSNGQPCDRSWTWQLAAGGWRLESVGMGNGGVRWRAQNDQAQCQLWPYGPTGCKLLSLPQSVAFWSWIIWIMEGARTSILKNKWKKYVMGHVTMWPPKLAVHYLAFFTSQLCKRRFMNADSSLVLVDAGGIINYTVY